MTNLVHLILRPERELALSMALMRTQGEYAQWLNHTRSLPGHLWQGRFFSCTLDENHLLTALRYVELNPVRANTRC